ncbi:hypothetical protein [Calidithermus terrae]|uniref:hypothetical protein n=1 Tax=Calidithermus terrae TaxID=1408545 RepID=UPI0011C42679|nr:hypothetical protein [Calidithermus terrae]
MRREVTPSREQEDPARAPGRAARPHPHVPPGLDEPFPGSSEWFAGWCPEPDDPPLRGQAVNLHLRRQGGSR